MRHERSNKQQLDRDVTVFAMQMSYAFDLFKLKEWSFYICPVIDD